MMSGTWLVMFGPRSSHRFFSFFFFSPEKGADLKKLLDMWMSPAQKISAVNKLEQIISAWTLD